MFVRLWVEVLLWVLMEISPVSTCRPGDRRLLPAFILAFQRDRALSSLLVPEDSDPPGTRKLELMVGWSPSQARPPSPCSQATEPCSTSPWSHLCFKTITQGQLHKPPALRLLSAQDSQEGD